MLDSTVFDFRAKKFVYIYCMLKKTGSSFLRYTRYLTKTASLAWATILSIKMSAKSKKIELDEELIAMWREQQSLWNVMSPSYWDKKERRQKFQTQPSEVFLKKMLLEILKIHKNYLCQSLFFNKVAGLALFLRIPFLTEQLGATASKVWKECRISSFSNAKKIFSLPRRFCLCF